MDRRKPLPSLNAARRGTTLVEAIVALGILGVAMTLGVQALAWSAAQRRLAGQRQVAIQEAANSLEQVRQLSWPELSAEGLAQLQLSQPAQNLLNSAQLRVWPVAETADPPGLEIRAEVQWTSRYGTSFRVGLTTWRFQTESRP